MNIWFLLWVFLTVFILGLFFWSFHILLRQKRTWIAFGEKNNLNVQRNALFKSAIVTGNLKGSMFYLYSEEQSINQGASRRFRTIIQFELPAPMPSPGIVASAEAANFARSLGLKESYVPEFESWNKSIVIYADNAELLKPYFTEERCKSLNSLMAIKSIATILIFDPQVTYLRFETADPFDDINKLDRFVSKAIEHVKILSI